ncbi:FAS1 domain-containing protein [Fennellomyces sp. T-0311]|nr:FAS1 domain-containing protein [Fennellomyces sp. T-0311]
MLLLVAIIVCLKVAAVVAQNTILDVLPNNGASALHDFLNNGHHEELVKFMSKSDATYTFFAPSNEAMAKAKLNSSNNYEDHFRYHILRERLSMEEINSKDRLRNSSYAPRQGKRHHAPYIIGTGPDGIWSFGGKHKIVKGDIGASNGVVHIIDHVLDMPGPAEMVLQKIPQTRDFYNQLKKLNMSLELFTHATIFAPTNDAITKLDEIEDPPTRALTLQHLIIDKSFNATSIKHSNKVVDNHGVGFNITHQVGSEINGIPVLIPDQIYDDGLIHVTDGIVLRGGLHQPDIPLPRPEDELSSRGNYKKPVLCL